MICCEQPMAQVPARPVDEPFTHLWKCHKCGHFEPVDTEEHEEHPDMDHDLIELGRTVDNRTVGVPATGLGTVLLRGHASVSAWKSNLVRHMVNQLMPRGDVQFVGLAGTCADTRDNKEFTAWAPRFAAMVADDTDRAAELLTQLYTTMRQRLADLDAAGMNRFAPGDVNTPLIVVVVDHFEVYGPAAVQALQALTKIGPASGVATLVIAGRTGTVAETPLRDIATAVIDLGSDPGERGIARVVGESLTVAGTGIGPYFGEVAVHPPLVAVADSAGSAADTAHLTRSIPGVTVGTEHR